MNAVSLNITTTKTTQGSDSKLLRSLFKLMQMEIYGLQDQLAIFAAKTLKLVNELQSSTSKKLSWSVRKS